MEDWLVLGVEHLNFISALLVGSIININQRDLTSWFQLFIPCGGSPSATIRWKSNRWLTSSSTFLHMQMSYCWLLQFQWLKPIADDFSLNWIRLMNINENGFPLPLVDVDVDVTHPAPRRISLLPSTWSVTNQSLLPLETNFIFWIFAIIKRELW